MHSAPAPKTPASAICRRDLRDEMPAKISPAVSVIIPLFNAERYVAECLTSLTNQTLKNFEIVVADDCSTDNSVAVVQNFFATFGDRLKVLQLSKNSGAPGIPRNFAINAAGGEYIFFLDADDLLDTAALENFYIVAKNFDADVVHAERSLSFVESPGKFEAGFFVFQTGNFVTAPTLETFDTKKRVEDFIDKRYLWWGCNKLLRRKFLVDNAITFRPLPRFEDFLFALKCLLAAKNYVRVPFVDYYYRIRPDSMSHKIYDAAEISDDLTKIFHAVDEFLTDEKFFRDNFRYRYPILDLFMREQLDWVAEAFFTKNNFKPAELFELLRRKIFSREPEKNVALTAYLFVAANLLTLHKNQSTTEVSI